MEALLVFWTLYCFYLLLGDLRDRPWMAGMLFGVAALGRVEYAVALTVPLAAALCWPWTREVPRRFGQAALSAVAVLGTWAILAICLGVWPVPVSWLSKVQTGRQHLFGPSFFEELPGYLRYGLFGDRSSEMHMPLGALVLGALAICVYFLRDERRFWWSAFAIHGVALLILLPAPGNYLWYFESYVLGFAALLAAAAQRGFARVSTPRLATVVSAGLALLALTAPRVGFEPKYPWDFHDVESRAWTYRTLARRHLGNGVFRYTSSLPPGHIQVCEIGIIAYFAGPSTWLADVCGLAQPGQLAPRGSSFLSSLFPDSSLHTIQNEYAEVRRITHLELEPGPIYAIGSGAGTLLDARRKCAHVVLEPRICMSF
jgi:hypothetical protein